MIKKSMLVLFFLLTVLVFTQTCTNNSNPDENTYIAEKWEMVTQAGFSYSLIFDNYNRTFKMRYFSECSFPVSSFLNGKFLILTIKDQYVVRLIFKDFSVDYILKYPYKSECASEKDKLTDAELKYWIECDENRYPLNYALLFREVKVINKKDKWPQYYDDLITHSFVYAETPNFGDDIPGKAKRR